MLCWLKDNKESRSSFRQKPEIKKKVLSEKEQRKRDWRGFKKLRKDKARRKNWGFGNSKTFYLRWGHRKMRTWVKERLRKEDYDLERGWKKIFSDPWMWD